MITAILLLSESPEGPNGVHVHLIETVELLDNRDFTIQAMEFRPDRKLEVTVELERGFDDAPIADEFGAVEVIQERLQGAPVEDITIVSELSEFDEVPSYVPGYDY